MNKNYVLLTNAPRPNSSVKNFLENMGLEREIREHVFTSGEAALNYLKPKKVYSFTTSFLLIVLGLGTVGISLFSDSFGVYHSACGLALSLFGFFWPIVEIKKPKAESSGAKPNLAIETQHRSLDHRIRGLANRATSINHMLKQIEEDLNVIDRGLDEPYLLID